MKKQIRTVNGFTMIELMLVLLVSSTIIAAVFSAYVVQNRVYSSQQAVAEMQQNLRAAISLLTRDIRMAGLDKTNAGAAAFVDNNFNFSNGQSPSIDTAVNTGLNQISFTSDLDGDGVIDQITPDIDGNGNTDLNEMEQISYRLSGTDLQRYSAATGVDQWYTIAENVELLEFRYLDNNGVVTANLDRVEKVEVAILARAGRPDPKFSNSLTYTTPSGSVVSGGGDNYRRRFLVTEVRCRNL